MPGVPAVDPTRRRLQPAGRRARERGGRGAVSVKWTSARRRAAPPDVAGWHVANSAKPAGGWPARWRGNCSRYRRGRVGGRGRAGLVPGSASLGGWTVRVIGIKPVSGVPLRGNPEAEWRWWGVSWSVRGIRGFAPTGSGGSGDSRSRAPGPGSGPGLRRACATRFAATANGTREKRIQVRDPNPTATLRRAKGQCVRICR